MPVVVPDFALLDFILSGFVLVDFILEASGPTLPSLDAPVVYCVCADAIAGAPNNEAITRAESASLDRMRKLLLWVCDAGGKTCSADLGSRNGCLIFCNAVTLFVFAFARTCGLRIPIRGCAR